MKNRSFATWQEVLDYIAAGGWLFYKAPLDMRAQSVRVVKVYKNGKLRLDPGTRDADPFTADQAHLPRLMRSTEV